MPGIRGLFIPGPTNVPQAVRLAMDINMEDQRAPDLPAFTLPLFDDLKKIFKTRDGQVFLFPSSGSGGWEAAMTNTLSPGDKVLIARFGQFSLLWADMCVRHGLDVDVVDEPWGEGVPVEIFAEKLKADKAHAYKAVLVTHNETATGVVSDVAAIRHVLNDTGHPALLFVDAVSSLASIDFRMDEWGVDVCVSGSQKGFMMPVGLAIVGVSQKALAARKAANLRRSYFDFEDMINTNKDGFFPYTPPTHMLRALRASVDLLLAEGLENVFARHYRLAEGVRRAVSAWGLTLCAKAPKWHSDTVSAIVIPEGFDSAALVKHAYNRYNLSLGVGLNKVAGRVFRIGHLGDLNEIMCMMALAGSEMAMRDLGIHVEAGSGVAAAQEYYRETGAAAALEKGRLTMDIHEYQAKEILAKFGVPIPKGALAYSPEQAAYRAREIGGKLWVVKAQVHTGGRGKAGGVKLCRNEDEVTDAADELLGKKLVTHQSGPAGKIVYRLYVEGGVAIARELYLGFVLDRKSERVMVVASAAGGMEIEDIAEEQPDSIVRISVEPAVGMQAFQARELAFALGLAPAQIQQAVSIILGCYRAFEELDATMVEINPLIVTEDGTVMALDAKMTFDDNALFRHPAIAELRDKSQEDARETRANDRGLSYVGLSGNIGCIVNGAGLAMATMDMIKLAGGEPANFLDIGGGATPERVAKAFKLVTSDTNVEAILVNIFAGINRCDWVAEGVVQALEKNPIKVPVIVRLAGTHVEEGRKILARSGLPIIRANTLAEAAQRAVAAWKNDKSATLKVVNA